MLLLLQGTGCHSFYCPREHFSCFFREPPVAWYVCHSCAKDHYPSHIFSVKYIRVTAVCGLLVELNKNVRRNISLYNWLENLTENWQDNEFKKLNNEHVYAQTNVNIIVKSLLDIYKAIHFEI